MENSGKFENFKLQKKIELKKSFWIFFLDFSTGKVSFVKIKFRNFSEGKSKIDFFTNFKEMKKKNEEEKFTVFHISLNFYYEDVTPLIWNLNSNFMSSIL